MHVVKKISGVLMILASASLLSVAPIGYSDFVPTVDQTKMLFSLAALGALVVW